MPVDREHESRKSAQLEACLHHDVQAFGVTTGFERYRLPHRALPDLDWSDVDLTINLLGKQLSAPVIISPMTGGCALGAKINGNLATAAQALGLAMGVGSQRAGLREPALAATYQVRRLAPDILLLANLGAVQLNAGFGVGDCRNAVEMIAADALCIHLNPLQEIHQMGGDRDFRGLTAKITGLCKDLGMPVVAKEVGWGLDGTAARELASTGVAAIDVAGAGGTSWYVIQELMAGKTRDEAIRSPLAGWGIPTSVALRQAVSAVSQLPVIASGGIRNGVDAAKALAMGAAAVGIAQPLLKPASLSSDAVLTFLEQFVLDLRTAMFCMGVRNVAELRDKVVPVE